MLTGCGFFQTKPKQSYPIHKTTQPGKQIITKEISNERSPIKSSFKTVNKNINFLLIGVDNIGKGRSRSDAILVARYEPNQGMLKLTSIMRDIYVKIPNNHVHFSKLNHAYYEGGSDLLKKTIEDNFSIKIDHTITVDLAGFPKIIDLMVPNGIKVNITKEMIDNQKIPFGPGPQVLHGKDILKYVRFRNDATSDFGRVGRQQEVLLAVKAEALKRLGTFEGLTKLPKVIGEAKRYVSTDLTTEQLIAIGATSIFKPITATKTMRIPVANSYENAFEYDAGSVLKIDFQKNNRKLDQFFNETGQGRLVQ